MPATLGGRLTVHTGARQLYTGRLGSAHPTPVRRPGPPALAATVDRSGAAHTELHNMRPLMTMIDTPTERAESAGKLFEQITICQHVALRNREERWPTPDFSQPGPWPMV